MKQKKPPTKEELKAILDKAIGEGRVEFANPLAAECMPSRAEEVDPLTAPFTYLKVEPIVGRKFRDARKPYSHDGGLCIQWGIKGFGFGEFAIVFRDGKWIAATEGMSSRFVKRLLTSWVEQMDAKR
jgi:hypothetical protein